MADITIGRGAQAGLGARGSMRRWLPALPGALFVVAFVVSFFMINTPNDNDSNAKWVNYFADRGHQVQVLISGFLLVIAGMSLLTFLTRLYARVNAGRANQDRDPLPLVAAAAAGGLFAAGGVVAATIPGAMIFSSLRVPSADVLRLTGDMSYPFFTVGGGFASAVAIVTMTWAAQRSGYFGRALGIFSYVAAAAAVASFMFFPLAVVLVWVLVVSVVMARRPARA